MRVLHAVRQYHPAVGGMERVVAALCQHLSKRGHDCGVVTLNRLWSDRRQRLPAEDTVAGVRVMRLPFLGGRRFFLARGLLPAVGEYDIVHVHGVDFFLDYLAFTGWWHRRPIVVSTHGGFFHTTWAWPLKRVYFHTITRAALGRVRRVLCVSRQELRRFAAIVPADRLEVLGNGVSPALGRVRNVPTPGLVISIGRIAANKRLDRLLEVFALVRRQLPQARLAIIGPDGEGLRKTLEAHAARLGIADCVEFAGILQDQAVHEYLSRAHLFVTASSYEAFGISAVEAMRAGLVVLASDIDAFREVVVHGESGFLTNFDDTRAAAEAVLGAVRLSEAARLQVGAKAREVAATYGWDRIVDRLESVYLEARGGGG